MITSRGAQKTEPKFLCTIVMLSFNHKHKMFTSAPCLNGTKLLCSYSLCVALLPMLVYIYVLNISMLTRAPLFGSGINRCPIIFSIWKCDVCSYGVQSPSNRVS